MLPSPSASGILPAHPQNQTPEGMYETEGTTFLYHSPKLLWFGVLTDFSRALLENETSQTFSECMGFFNMH